MGQAKCLMQQCFTSESPDGVLDESHQPMRSKAPSAHHEARQALPQKPVMAMDLSQPNHVDVPGCAAGEASEMCVDAAIRPEPLLPQAPADVRRTTRSKGPVHAPHSCPEWALASRADEGQRPCGGSVQMFPRDQPQVANRPPAPAPALASPGVPASAAPGHALPCS